MPIFHFALFLLLLPLSSQVFAVAQPDAGQLLRDTLQQPPSPQESDLQLDILTEPLIESTHGGTSVPLSKVVFEGNTVFSDAVLADLVGDLTDKSYDLAAMRALANSITRYYREQGYPFARAYLPAQRLNNGELVIALLEGRYGKVAATGELAEQVQPFLNALKPGDIIYSPTLERVALLIADLPGIRILPIIQPGAETGEADFILQATPAKQYSGLVNIDNHGNRFTGDTRLIGNVNWSRLLLLGDQLSVSGMTTDEQMFFGSVNYQFPIRYEGLRGELSYVRTDYQLAKDFSALDATGQAEITTISASYPILRAQNANLSLVTSLQFKRFNDKVGVVDTDKIKTATVLPIAFNFDKRDQIGRGGITYGSAIFTWGNLNIRDSQDRFNDRQTAQTHGQFQKINLDVARIQAFNQAWSGFLRLNSQWAKDNLDSAEKMSIGGARAVRAYPIGEGSADRAALLQLEIRYQLDPAWTPYGFIDAAKTQINANPFDQNQPSNSREYSGGGLGIRYNHQPWRGELIAAWRWGGGLPQADTRDDVPRVWANISYQF